MRCITAAFLVHIDYPHELECSKESKKLQYFSLKELKDLNIAATQRHTIIEYIDLHKNISEME